MEEFKGKVSRIWHNQGKAGQDYWVLSIQSEVGKYDRYSVFDWSLIQGVQEGDVITYKFKRSGRYNNLTEISSTEKPLGGGMAGYDEGDQVGQIARMSAIKSATQLLSNYDGDPLQKMTKTLELAREFEKYIFGLLDDDPGSGEGS